MGNRSTEDEHYCAYPEEQRSARTYTHYDLRLASGSTNIADWQVVCPQADNYPLPNAEMTDAGSFVLTHLECAAQCSAFFAPGDRVIDSTGAPTGTPQWIGENVDCDAYSFRPNVDDDKGRCRLFKAYTGDLDLNTGCTTDEAANWYVRNKPLLPDGEACPLHWTSYHHTPTGCEAFCAVAFQREGSDGTCMPGKPECANWLDDVDFPDEYITVNTWCICGAKLETEVSPGRYVNRGTIIESFESNEDDLAAQQDSYAYGSDATSLTGYALSQGRRLQDSSSSSSSSTSKWHWPEALRASVSAHHGDHFDVDNTCFEEISSFLTDHIPSTAQCASYMTMTTPPADLTGSGYDPASPGAHAYCTDDGTANDACCVAHRGSKEMSRVWLQGQDMRQRSVSQSFNGPTVVGTAVHTSQVAAVGNFVRRPARFNPSARTTNSPVTPDSFFWAGQRRLPGHCHRQPALPQPPVGTVRRRPAGRARRARPEV